MPRGQGIFDSSNGMNYPKCGSIVRKARLENRSFEDIAKKDFNVSKQALVKYLKGFETAAADLGDKFPTTKNVEDKLVEYKLKNTEENFQTVVGLMLIDVTDDQKIVIYATEWSLFLRDNVTIGSDDTISRDFNNLKARIDALRAKLTK